ncbi:MAG: glutamate--tRNA ligase family protein, partial [Terracidiphilus sp.]
MANRPPAEKSSYRGRLAPSPTGYLHVGHARTFWTASERARHAAGTLVMRMEDLDPDRSRSTYADAALEDLRWLGICWQEGSDVGGPFAPYQQSRRRPVYLDVWRKLLERGCIYPCRCSRRDLAGAAGAPHEALNADGRRGAPPDLSDDEPI